VGKEGAHAVSCILHHADCRVMPEVVHDSIDLAVTSPPYWMIKDYGARGQIGYGQSLHAYLGDLHRAWAECLRVLREGARLCVNVGDQFARARLFGRYRVIPLHAEIIAQCVALGFDYLGSIIWRKKTTMNTSGGAVVMGSFPFPPNGIVEIDFEYILLFRRPGKTRKAPRELKEGAALSRDEWKSWFSGHWDLGGARKAGHEAPFPEEIPRRLIRMFSFPGDTVLDPFLGTGTTAAVALELGRNAVGYEINSDYVGGAAARLRGTGAHCTIVERKETPLAAARAARRSSYAARRNGWSPSVPDMEPALPRQDEAPPPELHTVTSVNEDCTLTLDTGARVCLRGLHILDRPAALAYLRQRILKKKVFLKDEMRGPGPEVQAKVLLRNRISINAYLLKTGIAAKRE
jgi:DNA modification methylase